MMDMHDNEIKIDEDLVCALVTDQFPHWAALDLRQVESAGTDNAIYRLGDDFVLRLPRLSWGEAQVLTDHDLLPGLEARRSACPSRLRLESPGRITQFIGPCIAGSRVIWRRSIPFRTNT